MKQYEYKYAAALMKDVEALLNEHGREGWGVAFMHAESGHIHIFFFRERQD